MTMLDKESTTQVIEIALIPSMQSIRSEPIWAMKYSQISYLLKKTFFGGDKNKDIEYILKYHNPDKPF